MKALCVEFSTKEFVTQSLCDRKIEHLLQFFVKDHTDSETGRVWNVQARLRLAEFLATEIAEVERFNLVRVLSVESLGAGHTVHRSCGFAHLQSVGPEAWDGRTPKWNPERATLCHGE